MSEPMKETVRYLAGLDPSTRRERLCRLLKEKGIPCRPQQDADAINLLAGDFDDSRALPMFCAHYDVVPGSSGANDNLASVAVLIRLLERAAGTCRVAFLDGEERGHTGANLFCQTMDKRCVSCLVVLDVCGYGEQETYRIRKGRFHSYFRKLTAGQPRKKYHPLSLVNLPESDDGALVSMGVPVMLVSMMPASDAQSLQATQRGFPSLGQTMEALEVVQTIHGGSLDDPEYVSEASMNHMLCHLLEGLIQ